MSMYSVYQPPLFQINGIPESSEEAGTIPVRGTEAGKENPQGHKEGELDVGPRRLQLPPSLVFKLWPGLAGYRQELQCCYKENRMRAGDLGGRLSDCQCQCHTALGPSA